jgi:hypothetical protein
MVVHLEQLLSSITNKQLALSAESIAKVLQLQDGLASLQHDQQVSECNKIHHKPK